MLNRIARRLLTGSVRGYLVADRAVTRALEAVRGAVGGLCGAALTCEERAQVTGAAYRRKFGRPGLRALQAWEEAWLARRLPNAPARVLVGGAGNGAEVAHLVRRGYRVDALEPDQAGARACARLGAELAAQACYEELSRAVLDGAEGPAAEIARRRYDAIVLGWGSLSHVLEPLERGRLLEACAHLCPSGPILASFLMRNGGAGRARAAGAAIGRGLRRARRLDGPAPAPESVGFGGWFGFVHLFEPEEIEAIAGEIVRRVAWEGDPYPNVTFLAVA